MVARALAMEHDELVREMALVERLTTQERLKLARRRRKEQLRLCLARERDNTAGKRRKSEENWSQRRRNRDGRIHFVDGVVLLEAASRNDVEEVRSLLESGVDPDSTNEDGLTALHQCCIDDSEAMMTVLLDHGANVDAADSERWTPLHAAATCGHLHLVKQLVERGANLLAVNADGNMAYDICEHNAALEYIETQMARRGITQELIEETRGQLEAEMLADLQQRPANRLEEKIDQDATPLHVAAANGYLSVVKYLLENHVAVGPCDKDDWQPIHAAACWGHPRVIELLYQHGADLTTKTRNGETPFDVCEDPEIRERLEQLRNEQELKRTTDAQLSRVRRTQSTKHSIRRTSMRQKTLTPKKDVKEEARIRLGVEGSMKSQLDEPKMAVDLHDISITVPGINGTTPPSENGDEVTTITDPRNKANGHRVNNNEQPDGKTNSLESSSSTESGKIDIHVHVTVRTGGERTPPSPGAPPLGTLADLKLQRAQQRPPLPPGPGPGGSAAAPLRPLPAGHSGGGDSTAPRVTAASDNVHAEVELKKFVSTVPGAGGVTSEPPHEGTGCCVLQ